MNKQQIFDTAVAALIKQGEPSYRYGCYYRGQNGTKCAIGHLIPDEKYSEGLEGLTANRAAVRKAAGIGLLQASFAAELQYAHDLPADEGLRGADWLAAFKEEAREVAVNYSLSTKVLEA